MHQFGDRSLLQAELLLQRAVRYVDKPTKNDLHLTKKPVALVEQAIRNSSKSRDVVIRFMRRINDSWHAVLRILGIEHRLWLIEPLVAGLPCAAERPPDNDLENGGNALLHSYHRTSLRDYPPRGARMRALVLQGQTVCRVRRTVTVDNIALGQARFSAGWAGLAACLLRATTSILGSFGLQSRRSTRC